MGVWFCVRVSFSLSLKISLSYSPQQSQWTAQLRQRNSFKCGCSVHTAHYIKNTHTHRLLWKLLTTNISCIQYIQTLKPSAPKVSKSEQNFLKQCLHAHHRTLKLPKRILTTAQLESIKAPHWLLSGHKSAVLMDLEHCRGRSTRRQEGIAWLATWYGALIASGFEIIVPATLKLLNLTWTIWFVLFYNNKNFQSGIRLFHSDEKHVVSYCFSSAVNLIWNIRV